jgi:uncharacterized protein (TIGR00730 family)
MTIPAKEYLSGDTATDKLIDQLVTNLGLNATGSIVREIITSAVKLGMESKDIGDLKLANTALKELRYSFKVFSPYRDIRKVIIFGSARSDQKSPEYIMAETFARQMCAKGYMIVTGGGPGVMEAGNKGAKEGTDFALNIRLPFEQKPNPFVSQKDKLINYKYFFTRKLFFVKETDATAVFPGGFGTLDEGFEMLTLVQTGKSKPRPIILMEPQGSGYWHNCREFLNKQLVKKSYISPDDSHLFTIATTVAEAVNYIDDFYRVYHSIRYDGALTILRLNRAIAPATLTLINKKFRDILIDGEIRPSLPTPTEVQNNEFLQLPRLVMNFNRHHFNRLHELIHAINKD